jgi:RNA polymerase sigma-70 factor (ECF subfamily)
MGNLTNIFDLPAARTHADESAMVAELKAGSEEAFCWLIAQYHQPVYSLLARSLRDPADAADITQEVFLKIFRGIGGFHGEASLKTWIYRIALHEASNGRRWWSRHKECEITLESEIGGCKDGADDSPTLGEMLVDGSATPFDSAAQAEVRARVEAGLAQIPQAFRAAVILRDVEGFAYDEIAEMLQVSIGTVKSRIVRGRTALKQQILEAEQQRTERQGDAMQAGLAQGVRA